MTNLFFSTNMQGIVSSLFLGKDVLTNWKIFPLNIDGAISGGWLHSDSHSYNNLQKDPSDGPTFYSGTLQPNGVARDTFLMLSKWTKVVFKVFFILWLLVFNIDYIINSYLFATGPGLDQW